MHANVLARKHASYTEVAEHRVSLLIHSYIVECINSERWPKPIESGYNVTKSLRTTAELILESELS